MPGQPLERTQNTNHAVRNSLYLKILLGYLKLIRLVGTVVNLQQAGQLDGALRKHRQVLEIYKDLLLGENDICTTNVYQYIGSIVSYKGLYDESLVEHRKALKICWLILGENNRYTAISYDSIGCVLYDQGRHDDALIGLGKALTLRITLFGENRMGTSITYSNIGDVLIEKLQHEEALEKLCKAEAIFKRVSGENHQTTVRLTKNIDDLAKAYQLETAAQF
mmetsp:Transcript_17985/g.25625  ORF Transcript_17985/g.25625 Transcript_17985/m.25625 type:complete len:222 (+) Transcript_17985:258-923(+)